MAAMADLPIPSDCKPLPLDIEPGTHFWCACGRTSHPPFCDGSHKGTGIQPVKFEIKEPGRFWFCQCKRTAAPPFCDGSHKLPAAGA